MMRVKTILAMVFIFLCSCNRGTWISPTAYRPKKPNFSKPTNAAFAAGNPVADGFTSVVYLATKGLQNFDGRHAHTYMGFYADGNMFTGSVFVDQADSLLPLRNSLTTGQFAGRYTVAGDSIEIEYFTPADGGTYIKRNGIVKGDTIIFISKIPLLTRREIRYDTLVKTAFPVK